MKTNSYFRTISLFFFVLLAGCKKQKNYPSDTTDGRGTFGVTINNEQVLPCVPFFGSGGAIKTNSFQVSPTYFYIGVSARNSCDKKYTFGRYILVAFDSIQIIENTTYKFGNGFNFKRGQIRCIYSEDLNDYASDSTLPGTIIVRRFDPVSRIISTSFDAVVKEENTGKLVTLTQGKFDLKY